MHAGLLVIATGRYRVYVPDLVRDAALRFLPGHTRTLFLFTDAPSPITAPLRVVTVPTEHLAWPGPTLRRYHAFCEARALLAGTDVLYYLDADTRIVDEVDDAILPDDTHDLVAVAHPGFCGGWSGDTTLQRAARALRLPVPPRRWDPTPRRGSYETRPASTAYVGPDEGSVYFMGGFNGGQTAAFLTMAEVLRARIDEDAARGITAVWHDESHLNRYLIDHPPLVLPPSYGFPEGADLPFDARIVLLEKDHAALRAPL